MRMRAQTARGSLRTSDRPLVCLSAPYVCQRLSHSVTQRALPPDNHLAGYVYTCVYIHTYIYIYIYIERDGVREKQKERETEYMYVINIDVYIFYTSTFGCGG